MPRKRGKILRSYVESLLPAGVQKVTKKGARIRLGKIRTPSGRKIHGVEFRRKF